MQFCTCTKHLIFPTCSHCNECTPNMRWNAKTHKVGSQYNAGASIVSQVSGWRWSWLMFKLEHYLASVSQRSTNHVVQKTSRIESWWKNTFSRNAHTVLPASYCEPSFRCTYKSPQAIGNRHIKYKNNKLYYMYMYMLS